MALTGQAFSVAWYRSQATWGRRWREYLALVLLVGLVGGISMASLSAARRAQSSFSTYLASTNPSNLTVTVFGGSGNGGGSINYSTAETQKIADLPGVKRVRGSVPIVALPLLPDGAPRLGTDTLVSVLAVASVDGLLWDQDRLSVVQGRMASPDEPDEIVMTATAAHLPGFHVGQVIPYGIYTQKQESLSGFGTAAVRPHRRRTGVVQDDIDRFPTFVFFTPAIGQDALADGGQETEGSISYGLQLDKGNSGVPAVEREFAKLLPPGTTDGFHAIAPVEAKVDRAVKPLAIALGVFGGVAALAALLIGVQVISRQLREAEDELAVLRAIGAGPLTIAFDSLVGALASVLAGSLLAAGLCIALSPLSPLGPVRQVYPERGIAFDWTVLGGGLLVLIVGVGAIAVVLAYRGEPHRVSQRYRLARPSASLAMGLVASTGVPVTAVVGARFAVEPGRGRTAVPARSALPLYGWDWSYMLNASDMVPPQALSLLDHDSDVAAWTGYDYAVGEIDGQTVPFLFEDVHPEISPPIVSGHALDKMGQIVLGAATMAQLHKKIGETVEVSYGSAKDYPIYVPPTPLVIVGTATMPAVGFASVIEDHTSMGTGALTSVDVEPAAFRKAQLLPDPTLNGPDLVFVRLRAGLRGNAGL